MGPDSQVRKVLSTLGLLMLASVCAELTMAVVDNTLTTPVGRFLSVNSIIPRLGQILWALAFLVASWWASDNPRAQRLMGWTLVVVGVLLLVPPAFLARSLGAATAGLASGGLLRAHVQFFRAVTAYLTLTLMFLMSGRLLIRTAGALAREGNR